MTRLLITTSGCNIVERRLRAVSRLAANFSPAWDDVKQPLIDGIENSFDKEGPGWAKLDADTLRIKGSGGKILQDTRRLKNSLTRNPKTRETGSSIDIVTDVPYADAVFNGTSDMPARPIKISEHYKRQMSARISARLVEEYEHS
jgi:phage gpG-like protein